MPHIHCLSQINKSLCHHFILSIIFSVTLDILVTYKPLGTGVRRTYWSSLSCYWKTVTDPFKYKVVLYINYWGTQWIWIPSRPYIHGSLNNTTLSAQRMNKRANTLIKNHRKTTSNKPLIKSKLFLYVTHLLPKPDKYSRFANTSFLYCFAN